MDPFDAFAKFLIKTFEKEIILMPNDLQKACEAKLQEYGALDMVKSANHVLPTHLETTVILTKVERQEGPTLSEPWLGC